MPRDKPPPPKDLDSLIKQLTEQRATGLQQINEQRYAVALAAEILSIIFEYACIDSATSLLFPVTKDDSEFISGTRNKGCRYVPLVLGAVCARWRRVAWTTPTLWTSISLQLVPDFFFIRVTISVLRLYIQNSGSLPISLELDFQKISDITSFTTNSSDQTALELLREMVIQQNSGKFKAFRITFPPTTQWLPQSGSDFSALEDLSIGWPGPPLRGEWNEMPLQNITTLHRLYIHGVYNLRSATQLPWPNITVLHLYRVPHDISVSILLKCPNLISCQCYCNLAPFSYVEPQGPVTLLKLEDFGWDCNWDHFDITAFRFPSLKKLHLYDGTLSMTFVQAAFFPRISSTLSVLELDRLRFHGHWQYSHAESEIFFKKLFQTLVNVTKLTLSASCIGILSYMLSSLTPSEGCADVTLPNLHILQCRNLQKESHVAGKHCGFDGWTFVKMLRMRTGQGWNGPLQFEVSGECCIRWRKGAQREIGAMVAQGLELRIIEDARSVDWLLV